MQKRVVLFTGQDIGYQLVSSLATRADVVLLVIACRSKQDEANGYRSAIDACAASGVSSVEATRVDDALLGRIRDFAPDVIVSAYFAYLIPSAVLNLPKQGAYNIHPGILPRYRGKYPTPWYIVNGEREFGMALHEMQGGIDAGRVLVQETYPLRPDVTGAQLYRQTMDVGADLIVRYLDKLLAGDLTPREQTGTGSYYSTIEKRYQIDWNLSVQQIERRVRVHARPYLPAFSYLLGRIVYINKARPVDIPGYSAQGGGSIVATGNDGSFIVSCADGCLQVEEFDIYPPLSKAQREIYVRSGNRFE